MYKTRGFFYLTIEECAAILFISFSSWECPVEVWYFANVHFTVPFILLFTDNSPGEEPPATAEKEEETVESDHKGMPFNIETE